MGVGISNGDAGVENFASESAGLVGNQRFGDGEYNVQSVVNYEGDGVSTGAKS